MLIFLAALAAAAVAVPPALQIPGDAVLALQAHGRGVQIYVCEARSEAPGTYDWRFVSPKADLFGPDRTLIGHHYAGPIWEGLDGGKVLGELKAKSPSPTGASIDWLLLSAKAATGPGVFGQTRYVQRLNTVGGLPPAAGCTGDQLGDQVRVPYSADYAFYTAP